jgi:hypothetical protein
MARGLLFAIILVVLIGVILSLVRRKGGDDR